ncbi:MAG: LysE family transporter [Bacteriovoracaceae bacterium]|nr:LysE family transporter [Bacteriovoracaceae bacterium]
MNFFLEGFLLQASLIFALGAQNVFVLESGIKKQNHLLVATICSLCDALLIAIGVAGAASFFVQVPLVKIGFGILGVAFLVFYGLKKIKESFKSSQEGSTKADKKFSRKEVILLSLSFSLLNPHVYLDTIVLIGGYSAKFVELSDRLIFGFGATSFSVLWFYGLSLFAAILNKVLSNQKAMKIIALISGLILIVLALKLGLDVYRWII